MSAPSSDLQSAPSTNPNGSGFVSRILQSIPTMIVLAALAGLAWGGHKTGWKLPKFSDVKGKPATTTDEAWCAEHGVPEAICVECNPDLMPKAKEFGWCKKHGLPECVLCHPELAQLKTPPNVSPEMLERVERALALTTREENVKQCKTHLKHIQFSTLEAMEKAGIDIAPAWEGAVTESISANGEITYDQTHVAHLAPRASGTVWRADKQVGDPAKRGEVLALIDSAEVGRSKSEFLQSLALVELRTKLLDSMRPAFERGAIPETKFRETEASLQESRIRLTAAQQALVNLGLPANLSALEKMTAEERERKVQFLGLPSWTAGELDPAVTTAGLLPVKAPIDGMIVTRHVVVGEVVNTERDLFVVADLKQMWLTLDLRQEDARMVKRGQTIRFASGGQKDDVSGTIAWISTAVDSKTRTIQVRAELDNAAGLLRDHTFGTGKIILREEPKAIVVPDEAVQWDGDCHVVFVRDKNFLKEDAPKVFHIRKVRVGTKDKGQTEIIAGLLPGEIVATKGSTVLQAQLLKSRLGEGCGCHH